MFHHNLLWGDQQHILRKLRHNNISATHFLLQQETPAVSALPSPYIETLLCPTKPDIDHPEGEQGELGCDSNSG